MPATLLKARSLLKHREVDPDEVRMTLGEHLEELRSRVIKLLVGLFAGAVLCFVFRERLMQILLGPTFAVLRRNGLAPELVVLDPVEPFLTTLKVSVIVGFILSAPYGLYQIWAFVAAGLYKRERRFVQRFIPVSITLFMTGAVFFLFIVMPVFLNFLISFMHAVPTFDPASVFGNTLVPMRAPIATSAPAADVALVPNIPILDADPASPPSGAMWIDRQTHELRVRVGDETCVVSARPAEKQNVIRPNWTLRDTIELTLEMAAAFGVGFQVPVVVAFLATIGVLSSAQMGKSRRMVWFVMSIAAAVFTPSPDPFTMMLLLVPMCLLFEGGLFAAKRIERHKAAAAAAEDDGHPID
jgi:Tat protein translocase TatC